MRFFSFFDSFLCSVFCFFCVCKGWTKEDQEWLEQEEAKWKAELDLKEKEMRENERKSILEELRSTRERAVLLLKLQTMMYVFFVCTFSLFLLIWLFVYVLRPQLPFGFVVMFSALFSFAWVVNWICLCGGVVWVLTLWLFVSLGLQFSLHRTTRSFYVKRCA